MTDETEFEPLLTLGEAARRLRLPVWLLRRAAKRGEFPIYQLGNGRQRVRLSDIAAAIDRSCVGGGA